MRPGAIELKYKGGITFDLVDAMLLMTQKRLDIVEQNVTIRKRVYSILMECSQNLCIHVDTQIADQAYDPGCVSITIESEPNEYRIITGNFIHNQHIQNLKGILEEVNENASVEGLKKLYNRVLTNNNYSSKGGGGLGLIDIARKSNERLQYSFEAVDEKYSFFKLHVRIKKI